MTCYGNDWFKDDSKEGGEDNSTMADSDQAYNP